MADTKLQDSLKPALHTALRLHEIGDSSPYRLSFAARGRSGASFGFMQGDLAGQQSNVTKTFNAVLAAEGVAAVQIKQWREALSVHLLGNPLSKADTDIINAALQKHHDLVDSMDQDILSDVYDGLNKAYGAAAGAGRSIDDRAAVMMALWINMSGPPTKLLTWLSTGQVNLDRPAPALGVVVTAATMEAYLRATHYYVNNPGNMPHMLSSVDAGMKALTGTAPAETPTVPPYTPPAEKDHLVYEQKTGRMLIYEHGKYDTLAVGYSGSLSRHGVNDPDQQCVKSTGPIPRGVYTIESPRPGPSPYSLPLSPDPNNHMCGRSAFLIHGDSTAHPGDASDGCIILNRPEREMIVKTGLKTLVVVATISA